MVDGRIGSTTHGSVVTLTIDRPERSNALTPDLCDELRRAVDAVDTAAGQRVIVLRGAGGRAFCGGFDLGHVRAGVDDTPLRRLMASVGQARCPVVAVLDGAAVGAGFELACAADVRIAATGVRIGVPAVQLGVAYALDGLRTMIRSHPGVAGLLVTGAVQPVEGLPGWAIATGPGELAHRVAEVVGTMALAPPRAMAYMRRAIRWALEGPADRSQLDALAAEIMAELDEDGARPPLPGQPTGAHRG